MLAFLQSIDPTFARLLDRFVWAGIADRTRLLLMAGWTTDEIDSFLAREMRLDPFERRLVGEGFRVLRVGGHVWQCVFYR